MKHRFAVLLTLVIIISSLVGGFLGGNAAAKSGLNPTSPNEFLTNFTEALDIIEQTYVDKVSTDKLIYGGIRGMLRMLDPHSSFFDPKEFSRVREEQHSKYYGLGISVRPILRDRGPVTIVSPPTAGSPAERRGLRVGDVIMRIEGQSINDWTSDEVVSHLRGPKGTSVNITIERPGIREPLQFTVERDEIPLITIQYAFEIKPGVGYVKIDRFSESTADELRTKFKSLDVRSLSALLIDLRDNPGGLLNQAIEVSDFFLQQNEMVVSTRGRMDGSVRSYKAPGLERIRIPLVVLINRHSASASEIVAGALQDHDRALIVGETSFGKGLVQSVYPLDNNTGLALTTAKYYTPSGRLIQRDYSGSLFYYMNNTDIALPEDTGKREIQHTESGRIVYGGGGITPDIIEQQRELNRFEAILASKEIFFQYARRLTSGSTPIVGRIDPSAEKSEKSIFYFEVTDAILDDFKEFLRERKIDFTNEDISQNADFIKRRIRQDVYTSAAGLQEGYKIAVQGDKQVLKALEMMPEAKMLMTSARTTPAVQNPKK